MAFERYRCWDPEWAERVMNTEALQPPTHVFLAVHHPVKMYRTTLTALYKGQAGDRGFTKVSEHQLLKDLLHPKDFAFVPVLGSSGTGKSHLVRWLKENIPDSDHRHVLLIPKVDTNLWDVLSRILDLPGINNDSQFDDYRSRLRRAASELHSEKQAREKLLNNLAVACGINGPHQMQGLNEFQDEIAKKLPDLLYDPVFRDDLLRDGGVIHRLVQHTLGATSTVERLEEKRGFKKEDLPLQFSAIKKASAKAQGFYGLLLGDNTLCDEVVNWLNLHLNAAITELLELRGDALTRLMREVREVLATQNTELVLLIEDFAKLQGIDMQLLEAIITKPQVAGGKSLCPMRTVLACTTGYFGTLFDTVQTRVDFCVTLDSPSGSADSPDSARELDNFVARYLNGVRATESELQTWFETILADNEPESSAPPNRCEACEFRVPCHNSFGDQNGVGLYPLTSMAVRRMKDRASPDGFNPRFIIKDVLKAVMVTYAEDLVAGRFPPPALLEHFKGSRLTAIVNNDLKQLDSNPENRERRRSLLDLWADGTKVMNLDPGIHEAFALPPLKLGGTTSAPSQQSTPAITPSQSVATPQSPPERPPIPNPDLVDDLPEKLKQQLHQLDSWQNGSSNGWPNNFGKLDQRLVQDLREAVFGAVKSRINWDAEILVGGFFSSTTGNKPFKRTSINFEGQSVQKSVSQARLLIPTPNSSFTDAALALQALLLFHQHGSWRFTYEGRHGSYYFRRYAQQLDVWSEAVLSQLRCPTAKGDLWNPVPAVVELLALAARMANRPPSSKTSLDEQVSALFSDLAIVNLESRSPIWKDLFVTLQKHHEVLKDIVKSHAGCTKGGFRKVQVVDVTQLLEAVKSIKKDWTPKEPIPLETWDLYTPIRKTRDKVDALLTPAINEERNRLLAWLDQLRSEIPAETERSTIIDAVKGAIEVTQKQGVFAGATSDQLTAAMDAFAKLRLEEYLKSLERLRLSQDPAEWLVELGRDLSEHLAKVDELVLRVRQFLDASRKRLESEVAGLEGTGEYQATVGAIDNNMSELDTLLSVLKEEQS